MSMPNVEASEKELRDRLTAILRSALPLMRVLSVARRLFFLIGLYFRARSTSLCSIT